LTAHLAAEVIGVDLSQPIAADERKRLNDAFARHHVLVIRDQKYSPPDFLKAAQVFGELFPQERGPFRLKDFPSVGFISSEDRVQAGGPRIVRGEQFHTDHSIEPRPPKATILYGIDIPSAGGDTQFVNVHAAYDDLPADLKAKIDSAWALHVYESRWSPRKKAKLSAEDLAKTPSTIHPLVRIHADNGRKAFYINTAHIDRIIDMDDTEARAILDELMRRVQEPKYEYRHKWRKGDMVIWDNRSVLHQANGDYDRDKEKRFLYRLMLKGEAPIPAKPDSKPKAAIEREVQHARA
jgi:alpha-ketoglutarate-dependent taurine dioxygenase